MGSPTLGKLVLQAIILWNSFLFLPVVVMLCYFGAARALLK